MRVGISKIAHGRTGADGFAVKRNVSDDVMPRYATYPHREGEEANTQKGFSHVTRNNNMRI